MLKKQTSNTFTDGLQLDVNPLMAQKNTWYNALNATLNTMNGNEYSLQNDMGNCRLVDKDGVTAGLPAGYTPVGTCELGGVIYIASYNPTTGKGQLGSFPSPEYGDELEGGKRIEIDYSVLLDPMTQEVDENIVTSNKTYTTTNITSIVLLLDDKMYNSGDGFYILYGDLNSSGEFEKGIFPEYLDYELFTKYNGKEYSFTLNVDDFLNKASLHDFEDIPELLHTSFDVFNSKWPGYLYLRLKLKGTVTFVDRDVTSTSLSYTFSYDEAPSYFIIIENTTEEDESKEYIYKTKINQGTGVSSYYHYFDTDNKTVTISYPELTNEQLSGILNIQIIPVYEYQDGMTILRYDLANYDTVDFSKIGQGIVNEIWRYSKDDSGVNLVFDIQDYLPTGWNIDDVLLEYMSHRDMNVVVTKNSAADKIQTQDLQNNVTWGTTENILYTSEATASRAKSLQTNQYTLGSFIRCKLVNSELVAEFSSGSIVLIDFNNDIVYNLQGNKVEPDGTVSISDLKGISIYSSSYDSVLYNITVVFSKTETETYQVLWNYLEESVTISYYNNSTSEGNENNENSSDDTTIFGIKLIQYTTSQGDIYNLLKYDDEDEQWYIMKTDKTESNEYDTSVSVPSSISGKCTLEPGWVVGETVKYNFLDGDTWEIYELLPDVKIQFRNTAKESEYILFYLGEANTTNDTTVSTGNNSNPIIDPGTITTDKEEYTESSAIEYTSDWVKFELDVRRFADGIYRVTIPFSDSFEENSLYIVRITTSVSKDGTPQYYYTDHVLFTNGMYNDYFNKSYLNLTDASEDTRNFDNIAVTISPNINWNLRSVYDIKTITDEFSSESKTELKYIDKISLMVFPEYVYDQLSDDENTKINEVFTLQVESTSTITPYIDLDYGFDLVNYNLKITSTWELPKSDNIVSKSDPNNVREFTIVDTLTTNFELTFDKGLLLVDNYFRPVVLTDTDYANYRIHLNEDMNRIGVGAKGYVTSDGKHVSRYAGFAYRGGGQDDDGGGGYTYRFGEFPIGTWTDLNSKITYVVQGRSDYSSATAIASESLGKNKDDETLYGEGLRLKEAFGEGTETVATKITESIKEDEGKIKFPDDDFTDNIRSSASTGSKYPLFIPVMLVNGQNGLFQEVGQTERFYSTYKPHQMASDFADRFSQNTQPSKYRILWIYGLVYIDGDYQYVPFDSFFIIYDGSGVVGRLASDGKNVSIASTRMTVGEYFLSYLSSIYYKSDAEKSYTEKLGYLSQFTYDLEEEVEINHSVKTPTYQVENGLFRYDNKSQKLIIDLIRLQFGEEKECTKYKLDTSVLEANTINLQYTYTNPKFEIYQPISEKTLENFVRNPIDDILLTVSDTDSELWIRENNSKEIVPISTKETYKIASIKPYYYYFNHNDSSEDAINKYGSLYPDDSDVFIKSLSSDNTTYPYVKDTAPITINIPSDFLIMLNGKLVINYDAYKSEGNLVLKGVWKNSNNSDALKTNKIVTSSVQLFGSNHSIDFIPAPSLTITSNGEATESVKDDTGTVTDDKYLGYISKTYSIDYTKISTPSEITNADYAKFKPSTELSEN